MRGNEIDFGPSVLDESITRVVETAGQLRLAFQRISTVKAVGVLRDKVEGGHILQPLDNRLDRWDSPFRRRRVHPVRKAGLAEVREWRDEGTRRQFAFHQSAALQDEAHALHGRLNGEMRGIQLNCTDRVFDGIDALQMQPLVPRY